MWGECSVLYAVSGTGPAAASSGASAPTGGDAAPPSAAQHEGVPADAAHGPQLDLALFMPPSGEPTPAQAGALAG